MLCPSLALRIAELKLTLEGKERHEVRVLS